MSRTIEAESIVNKVARLRREGEIRGAAIRIVHKAWFDVSGECGEQADAASAILSRVKSYLTSH